MIKFKSNDNKLLIGLGLSEGNLKKLREGKPIYIMKEELGIDFDLLIFWGRTEKEMVKKLRDIGAVNEKTEIKKGFVEQ